jgi:hypothetical protein
MQLPPGAWRLPMQPNPLLAAVMPHTLTLLPDHAAVGAAADAEDEQRDGSLQLSDVPPIALLVEESFMKVSCL